MELTFQSQPYHYLRCVLREDRNQEETAEIIVPDSYPDIVAVTDCFAEAILRGKDCRDGSVTVAGGIKGAVLCAPEDQSYPRNLETYIPFTVKFEDPGLTAHAQVLCTVRVCTVDARMINSRKVFLRINLCCEMTAFEKSTDMHCSLDTRDPCLQLKEVAYATKVPFEVAEKSFSVSDSIELPMGYPPVTQIYGFHCSADLSDEKLVGNKAVFKGILRCKLLYLAENEKIYSCEQTLPFSQYCEMQADYDEESVQTKLMITGYDLEEPSGNDGQIQLTVNILAQCRVDGTQVLQLIEDAYAINGVLNAQWKEFDLEGSLDQQAVTLNIRQRIPGDICEISDSVVYWGLPEVSHNGERVKICVPAFIRVLGYQESGQLQSLTSKTEAVYEMTLSQNGRCCAAAEPVGEVVSAVDAGGAEVKCSIRLSISCHADEKLRTLCAGEIEQSENEPTCSTVIVRMVEKDTPLWELAKAYRTTVEDIQGANQLDGSHLPEDTMLLLPIA